MQDTEPNIEEKRNGVREKRNPLPLGFGMGVVKHFRKNPSGE